MQRIFTVIFSIALLGCSTGRDKIYPVKPLVIVSKYKGVANDIRLSYTESKTAYRSVIYKVNATYNGKNIGFDISVPEPGYARLYIKSNGVNSDNFLHVMQQLYNYKVDATSKFVDTVRADGMNMGEYIDGLKKNDQGGYIEAADYKLFFNPMSDDDYAELFLDINTTEHWIELVEKDPAYRSVILRILTKH